MKETTHVQDVAAVRELLAGSDPAAGPSFPEDDTEARRALTRVLTAGGTPPAPRRRGRRRLTVGVTVVLAFGAMAAGADAAGVIPTGVVKALKSTDDKDNGWGNVDTDKATILIADDAPNGTRVEWWRAPGKISGSCSYLRRLKPGGNETNDSSYECGEEEVVPPANTVLVGQYGRLAGDLVGVIGRAAPPAAQIKVKFTDGDERIVPVRAGGFFLQTFDREEAPPVGGAEFDTVQMTVLDGAGKAIATLRVEESSI